MENKKLDKVTFLRLFPKRNFEFVDEIINEIENKSKIAIVKKEKVEKVNCEIQTDNLLNDNDTIDKKRENNEYELEIPQLSQITFTLPLSFGNSFQYNNEAEYESLKGRISNRFRNQEISLSPIQISHQQPTSVPPKSSIPMDESLETQQMRRLGEFVAWRRSLLHDCYT